MLDKVKCPTCNGSGKVYVPSTNMTTCYISMQTRERFRRAIGCVVQFRVDSPKYAIYKRLSWENRYKFISNLTNDVEVQNDYASDGFRDVNE